MELRFPLKPVACDLLYAFKFGLIDLFVDLLSKLLTSRPQFGLMAHGQTMEWLDTPLEDMDSMVGTARRQLGPADTWSWLPPTLHLVEYPEPEFNLLARRMGIHAAAECVLPMIV